ncbi:vacuolar import and degradation protein 27 (VID27) [Vairimorpha necatrix]|uniref:Vacuolar import and degradation protein 27 (VID27) n=1 Tax=Vairimorpha necatrix TaxID=6039 RepID=A0AAX4JAK0_9MICR
MVFKLIKNMFKKKDEISGDLKINQKLVLENCNLNLVDSILSFSESYKFEIKNIKDLKLDTKSNEDSKDSNSLSFTYDHKKIKFTSNSDLKDLFLKIHPLTSENTVLFSTINFIYKFYDTTQNNFKDTQPDLLLRIIEDNKTKYLKIESDDEILHFEEINNDTQYYLDKNNLIFVWSVMKDDLWFTFNLQFDDKLIYLEFVSKYLMSTYKIEENEEYFEKMEIENYKSKEKEEIFYDLKSSSEEETLNIDKVKDDNNKFNDNKFNEHLVVGNERAFVTRGSSVGIFENTNDGLEFRENLSEIMENPAKKIISHDNCKSLIYLDKNNTKILHKIDLERGDVVETWNVNKNINDYFEASKLVDNQTLVGLSDYSVFRIDPRTKEKVTESKDYKMKNEFMCGMSTSKGHVAVASKNGDLRLYDKLDKRAKSLLPGFGDEVKHVDVTTNGQNIICTCKNYLLLYVVDGNYKNQVGKDKPVPKKLTLRPEHLAYINEEINFTPAKFSTDSNEDSIITSTGKYVVRWNLKEVISGQVYSYQLSKCSDLVVADNFEFGVNDNIIVTMPDDVRSLKGSKLRRPNKRTFE